MSRIVPVCLIVLFLLPGVALAQLSKEEKQALAPKIEEGLNTSQKSVRRLSVLALGAIADKKGLKELKSKYASDPDPVVQNAAFVALALRGQKAGTQGIQKALSDADLINLEALIGELLLPLDEKAQKKILSGLLKKPSSEEHRRAFLKYVARDGSADLFKLAEGVTKIKDEAARNEALRVLVMHPRPEALSIAKKALGSKSESTRAVALELARALKKDGEDVLVKALDNKNEDVKAAAEKHLIAMRHRAIIPLLKARVEENPKDTASIEILLNYDGINLNETLTPLVDKENPSLDQKTYNQILGLIAVSKSDKAHALITAKLASTFPADREAASYAIGFTGDRMYSTALNELLFDGSSAVRRNAARSMGQIGDPAYIESLNKSFQGDSDPEVKLLAVQAMGRTGDPAVVNDLMFILTGGEKQYQIAALDALVEIKSLDAAPAIELLAQDPDPTLRWQAVVSLFLIDKVVYAERLKRAVTDAPEDAFFATLVDLPDDTRAQLEEEVLRSERASLALGIVRSAANQGRAGAAQLRQAAKLSPDKDVFNAAVKSLARYHMPEDLELFVTASKDSDREIRILGLQTLLYYPVADTEAVFKEAMEDDEPLIKAIGIYGLVK